MLMLTSPLIISIDMILLFRISIAFILHITRSPCDSFHLIIQHPAASKSKSVVNHYHITFLCNFIGPGQSAIVTLLMFGHHGMLVSGGFGYFSYTEIFFSSMTV